MDQPDDPDRRNGARQRRRARRRASAAAADGTVGTGPNDPTEPSDGPAPATVTIAAAALDPVPPTGVDEPATDLPSTLPDDEAARILVACQQLLDLSPLGMLVVDDGSRVVLHNRRAAELLEMHDEDLENGRFRQRIADEPYDIVRRDVDGAAHTLRIACRPFDGLDHPAWSVTIEDTLAPVAPDEEDRFGSSTHDPLTGLPGRELLLNHVFETARRSRLLDEERFAVVVVDLEQFGRFNDDHGEAAGDRVLRTVGARLTSAIRPGDYVSRSGDDEFAVVLPPAPLAAHLAITDRIDELLSQPIMIDDTEHYVPAVIGIAEHVESDDEDSILERAELAVRTGSPGAPRLAPRPADRLAASATIAAATVLHAVSEGQMFLLYQPVFATTDGEVVSLEALVRWEHPDDGLVTPDEFVRVAEESGGIVPLGEWVITEVCEQIAAWRADRPDYVVPPVSVNVSARQLGSDEIRRHVHAELDRHQLGPEVIRFEITEEVLLDRDPRVERLLRQLAADGIGLVLDEFGTGTSSLTRVQQAPLVGLKIDRAFVARLMTHELSAQLVLASIGAGQSFDVPVTAIGVETDEQRAVLARWGCEHLQGYLLARPMNAVEASRFFARDPDSLRVHPSGPLLRSSGTFARPA